MPPHNELNPRAFVKNGESVLVRIKAGVYRVERGNQESIEPSEEVSVEIEEFGDDKTPMTEAPQEITESQDLQARSEAGEFKEE